MEKKAIAFTTCETYHLIKTKQNTGVQTMLIVNQSVQEVYIEITRKLPPNARLQLAALILNGLTNLDKNIIDDSDTWTEEDQLEIAAFSMQNFTQNIFEEEAIAS
jgi:hypothetical protein